MAAPIDKTYARPGHDRKKESNILAYVKKNAYQPKLYGRSPL